MYPLTRTALPTTNPAAAEADVHDLRFARLLGMAAWKRLTPSVRRRFSHHKSSKATVVYEGRTTHMTTSGLGKALAFLTRAFGGPLPTGVNVGDDATVVVHDNDDGVTQTWTRVYHRQDGTPQIIYSTKCFHPEGGLEERVFGRLSMTLDVTERDGNLAFNSSAYFLRIAGFRLRLPHWIGPGALEITHEDIDGTAFDFGLVLTHPLFGELIRQTIRFED